MSWTLNDPDSKVVVNGTIMDFPARGEMFEVLLSLREVSHEYSSLPLLIKLVWLGTP